MYEYSKTGDGRVHAKMCVSVCACVADALLQKEQVHKLGHPQTSTIIIFCPLASFDLLSLNKCAREK